MRAYEIQEEIGALAEGHDVAEDVLPFVRAAVLDVCDTSDQGKQQYVVSMDAVDLPNVDAAEIIWPRPLGERLRDLEVPLKAITDPTLWSEARQQWELTDPPAWSAFSHRLAAPLVRRLGLRGAWEALARSIPEAPVASTSRRFVKITYPRPGAGPAGRELPFVVGVIADLSGRPSTPLPPVKDRNFLPIDRAGFSQLLAAIQPRLAFRVDNVVDQSQVDIELHFRCLEDFEPHRVIQQVEHLRILAERGAEAALSRQLDAVLHAPEFQKLERTWRGLHLLVSRTEPSEFLNIQVLDASKQSLYRDLVRAQEFDRSDFFKLVHDSIYGASGPAPFGVLVSDADFGGESADIEFLDRISTVAAAIHAPFLAAADDSLFHLASLDDMERPTNPYVILKAPLHAKWRLLRKSEDSRYLGLTFGTAVWAFASSIANSFSRRRSFAGLEEPGGGVAGEPAAPSYGWLPPNLGSRGFFHCTGSAASGTPVEAAAFSDAMSVHEPVHYDLVAATAASVRSAELFCVFATSRFAHYVQALLFDHPTPFASREHCEGVLNDWIGRYVASATDPIRRPLQAAHVHLSHRGAAVCAALRIAPVYKQMEWPWSPRLLVTIPPGKIAPDTER